MVVTQNSCDTCILPNGLQDVIALIVDYSDEM